MVQRVRKNRRGIRPPVMNKFHSAGRLRTVISKYRGKNKMKKNALWIVSAWIVLVMSSTVCQAITITMVNSNVALGGVVNQEIHISGLGGGISPSVGSFDIDVNYDADILRFDSVTFGNQLDLLGFGSFQDQFSNTTGTAPNLLGVIDLLEISFDTIADLDALQTPSFTLATLAFEALQLGMSTLDISGVVSDAAGSVLPVSFPSGRVTVTSTVPEPGTGLLLVLGVIALVGLGVNTNKGILSH